MVAAHWSRATLSACILLTSSIAVLANDLRFEHVMSIGSEGDGPGQFQYIEDFAFSRDGHLLVTDAAHAWVQVFDRSSGKFITRFGGKGDQELHLEKPEGIAVDPDGNVFVADYRTGFIKKYDSKYTWLKTFSSYGSEPGQNMMSEFIDIYAGRLYVPDIGNHRVNVFDLDGNHLFNFAGRGTANGELNNPEAAKASSDGRIYVTDLKNNRIQVFDPDGKFLFGWGSSGSEPGQFRSPAGLAFDKHDNVYITEIGNNRIQVFDKTGKFLTMWGRKGTGIGEFGNLHGVIVNKETGWVYVADTANNRFQVFRPATASPRDAPTP